MGYGDRPGGPADYGSRPPGTGYGGHGMPYEPPDNHLVAAILTTLFCCLPLGIVAIVKSAQVNSQWAAGDRQGALTASREAKTWWKRSLIFGIVMYVLLAGLIAVLIFAASSVPYYPSSS